MRRVINWVLLVLALAALAAGAAVRMGLLHPAAPAIAFGVAAAVFVALLAIRSLPLSIRRPVVFLVTLALLAAITAGLAYFQFVIKPAMVKGFISAAFVPKPTTVGGRTGPVRKVAAGTQRDRHLAGLSGHLHRSAGRGGGLGDPLRIGAGREARATC